MFAEKSFSDYVSLQDMQHELEQLTKELRQVNLQQFIKQTGTKVTVLPAEPTEDERAPTSQGICNINLLESLKEWLLCYLSNILWS